ncbi:hypothetical protein T484DRAFT_1845246 [Baffinella frigidus]|nr:hypothetical protein T484DRAFT_1845246 [Cryptophyta sp. CCMP2293]
MCCLDRHKNPITVISLYNPDAGIKEVLRFVELRDGKVAYKADYMDIVGKLVQRLDDAEYLCSYNGVSFDLPYIQTAFNIPNETVQRWVLKTYDILETCRRAFNRTFSLNMCLELNQIGSGKTGSGLEAVHQAERGDWDDLERYCLDDSILTHRVSSLAVVNCCENFYWRKVHDGATHIPTRVLQIYTKNFPALTFGYGPVCLAPSV